MVDDVDAAMAFYEGQLNFTVEMHLGPGFAMLARDDLRLAINAVGGAGGASKAKTDASRRPEEGIAFSSPVRDIEAVVERLRAAYVSFRNDIVSGMGGKQILIDDPSGNCV
jgi:predicted enzyme related to lactoylglutathione lyase